MNKLVIRHNETGLFWNLDGWQSIASANRYTEAEALIYGFLPHGGAWLKLSDYPVLIAREHIERARETLDKRTREEDDMQLIDAHDDLCNALDALEHNYEL